VEVKAVEVAPEPEVVRVETLSAAGYMTLIESEYREMEDLSRKVPFSVFQYFAVQVWWRKVLEVKSEVGVLNSEEGDALRVLRDLGDIPLTPRMADYFRVFSGERLSGIGNHSFSFSGSVGVNGFSGFPSFSGSVRVDSTTMWLYALFPVPGVALSAMYRDFVRAVSNGASAYQGFSDIRPYATNFPDSHKVFETGNILCWLDPDLSSDRKNIVDLFTSCGIENIADLPSGFDDQCTNWLISGKIMRYVSSAMLGTGTGVSGILSWPHFSEWHPLQENYIRVKQTEESFLEIFDSPTRWCAVRNGISTIQSDVHLEDVWINYVTHCGFRVEISFQGVDGTTNHSPWYGKNTDTGAFCGPGIGSLLGYTPLVLSRRLCRSSHSTFHTEAMSRLEHSTIMRHTMSLVV